MNAVRVLIHCSRLFGMAAIALGAASTAFGQGLNPNPLMPSGVGSASDMDMGRGYQGPGGVLGRGIGGTGDVNPADTLLKEMNGTNNGRRTGRNALRDPRRRTTGYRPLAGKVEGTAVRFETPGAYEEAIYGSRRGSYSNVTRRRSR
jgi:hypothetical protein